LKPGREEEREDKAMEDICRNSQPHDITTITRRSEGKNSLFEKFSVTKASPAY
jgi:hypothetical protein